MQPAATAQLPIEGEFPDLDGATTWLNSEPLSPTGSDRRREAIRARMEARVEATDGNRPQQALTSSIGEVLDLQDVRETVQ